MRPAAQGASAFTEKDDEIIQILPDGSTNQVSRKKFFSHLYFSPLTRYFLIASNFENVVIITDYVGGRWV